MYTFMTHAPAAREYVQDLYKNPITKNSRNVSVDAILLAENFFDMKKEDCAKLSWEKLKAMEELAKFLMQFGPYYCERICADGFGEDIDTMYKESGEYGILFPKLAREYIMDAAVEQGAAEKSDKFKDLPKQVILSNDFVKLRTMAFQEKYGKFTDRHPHKCPVCGTKLENYGGVCKECRWIDDWIREQNPDDAGAYDKSLNEFRKMYRDWKKQKK